MNSHAPMFSGSSWTQTISSAFGYASSIARRSRIGTGIQLLDAADGDVAARAARCSLADEVDVDLARAHRARGGSRAARAAASSSGSTIRKRPSASSRGVDATSGWRSRLFGVSTTSGSGSTCSSAAWRRSRWKYCAAVVQLAMRMLMSAASWRNRSGRALA